MDYRLLLIFIFAFSLVRCEDTAKNSTNANSVQADTLNTKNANGTNSKPDDEKTAASKDTKETDKLPATKLPSLCTVCNCTGSVIDCENRNLTHHFEDSQWPNISISVISFKGNLITTVKPFPQLAIEKIILQGNNISKIENGAFKQLINLTELDLSHNQLTKQNLQPHVFEGRFSTAHYEPLRKLRVLDLSYNSIHSFNQDLFEHIPTLKVLNLSRNLFTQIDLPTSIAITSIEELEELDLSYCGLKALPDTQFYSTRSLKKLDLSGNQFSVAPTALAEAASLESLYLDENPIQVINHLYAFPTMPKLKLLSLCCMPHLTMIGPGAFSGLQALEHLHVQNCPKLESIDEYALANHEKMSEGPVWPPLKILDLSDNALRYLPAHFVASWDSLEELNLMHNKWSCDCDNQYLVGVLLPQHGQKLMGDNMNMLTCASPPEHQGKNLTSLFHRKLRCLDIYGAKPERDATILIGMLIGLLLAIPICLVVFILWRRGYCFCGSQGPASFSRAFYKRASPDDEF